MSERHFGNIRIVKQSIFIQVNIGLINPSLVTFMKVDS